jgi:hypothetical protein
MDVPVEHILWDTRTSKCQGPFIHLIREAKGSVGSSLPSTSWKAFRVFTITHFLLIERQMLSNTPHKLSLQYN